MFVYLSGSEKGKTRIFTQDRVTVGSSDESDLKLVPEDGGVLPNGVVAEVVSDNGLHGLVARQIPSEIEITINGLEFIPTESEPERRLEDGDTIQFGHGLSAASLLFQVLPENFTTVTPVRMETRELEPLSHSRMAQPHPLTATLFVKELASSLWAEIPRKAKLVSLLTFSLLTLLAIVVLAYGFLTIRRVARQNEKLTEAAEGTSARWQQAQDLIRKQQMEIDRLRQVSEQTRLFAQNIAERYSPGVCLIVGSYGFVENGTGRPLRYESADLASATPVDRNGNLLASVDGAGPPVELEFSGTGFVIENGLIATNKHVVQPWSSDQTAEVIMGQGPGFKPRLDGLSAFFPSAKEPFDLKLAEVSDQFDLSLCSFTQGETALPSLPISHDDLSSSIGEPVVLLGYPTGVDGLLQRIDRNERQAILSQHGKSIEDVASGLASRGLVRPLTTTGIVSDALPGRIVHSAHTTEGGSGGPLFDRDYRVIAINSAILAPVDGGPSFGGSNFGVPIRAVSDLLDAYHQGNLKGVPKG
ncbi:MAG TPA: trypsin-like peptidase domain-containing protein [Blastocatellia bacterium]|nr:trypsin-like peptidase domain-containing protein [Blastocatellia bacterium]